MPSKISCDSGGCIGGDDGPAIDLKLGSIAGANTVGVSTAWVGGRCCADVLGCGEATDWGAVV